MSGLVSLRIDLPLQEQALVAMSIVSDSIAERMMELTKACSNGDVQTVSHVLAADEDMEFGPMFCFSLYFLASEAGRARLTASPVPRPPRTPRERRWT